MGYCKNISKIWECDYRDRCIFSYFFPIFILSHQNDLQSLRFAEEIWRQLFAKRTGKVRVRLFCPGTEKLLKQYRSRISEGFHNFLIVRGWVYLWSIIDQSETYWIKIHNIRWFCHRGAQENGPLHYIRTKWVRTELKKRFGKKNFLPNERERLCSSREV